MFRVPCSISTLWLPVTSSSLCSSCCLRHKSFITIRHSVARCKREKVTDSIHPRRIGWRDCGRLFQGKPPPPPPWGWFGEGVFIWAVWLNEKRAHTRFPVQFHTPTSYLIHCSWCWIEVYLISLTSTRLIAVAGDPPFRPNEMHPCHPQKRIVCYTHEIGYVYSLRIRNISTGNKENGIKLAPIYLILN